MGAFCFDAGTTFEGDSLVIVAEASELSSEESSSTGGDGAGLGRADFSWAALGFSSSEELSALSSDDSLILSTFFLA